MLLGSLQAFPMDIWSSLSIRQFNSLITAFQILIRRVSRPDISNSRLTAIQVFAVQAANKQTQTFGQLLILGTIVAPSTKFTGPVDVVLGQNDLVFCGGDCTKPQDQSALVIQLFLKTLARDASGAKNLRDYEK